MCFGFRLWGFVALVFQFQAIGLGFGAPQGFSGLDFKVV